MKAFFWALFEVVETVAVAVIVVVLVRTFVAQPFLVDGASMEPDFKNGDYLLVDEVTYRFRAPERGDIVVFKYPLDPRVYYIKRVIGLPGEKVSVDGNSVTITEPDGTRFKLAEPYIARMTGGTSEHAVKEGEVFVMGDNRDFSYDSRRWGPLPQEDLVGIVRFRLWPVGSAMAFGPQAYN